MFQKHARTAEKHGAVLSIEGYYRNIIGTIDLAERLLNEVNSPALKLVMDPCNYFRKEDLHLMKPMLETMFQRLGDRIAIAHAKDVKASATAEDLPAAGLGVLDYPLFLRLLAQLDRPLPLVVEHLPARRGPDATSCSASSSGSELETCRVKTGAQARDMSSGAVPLFGPLVFQGASRTGGHGPSFRSTPIEEIMEGERPGPLAAGGCGSNEG